MKFGGTSVGAPARMHQVTTLISGNDAKLVVLSAVSGTTNSLEQIAIAYKSQKYDWAHKLISEMELKYEAFVEDLYKTEESKKAAYTYLAERFQDLKNATEFGHSSKLEKVILAQGELISTHLMLFLLQEKGITATLLPALEFMRTSDGEPDEAFIETHLKHYLEASPPSTVYLTQGYICRNEWGDIDNLRRGGSDYTASLVGAAIRASEIQIWTDIDGMHNNDPRVVNKTYPVHELSFEEAAELAYFGAKILHPSSVLPAQKMQIPVRLLNTMQPEAIGTLISSRPSSDTFKAAAAKDGIIALKIRSSRMLMAYGFLRKVFEVFEQYKTSIDMITTSEVAVSITIDNGYYLEEIIRELQEFGIVEVDHDQSIICVVGNFSTEEAGIAVKVLNVLKDIPVRMISSGGSRHNISLLVQSVYKVNVLKALNSGIFGIPSS